MGVFNFSNWLIWQRRNARNCLYLAGGLADIYAIFMLPGLDFCMHCMTEVGNKGNIKRGLHQETPLHPGSIVLRRAIRRNIVSFPSQIPVFLKQSDAGAQWRAVLLFFVRGWSSPRIAERFRVPTHRVWQIIEDWSVRAWELGYVRVLDPEAFAACCRPGAAGTMVREDFQPQIEVREEALVSHAA